jgi:hypothetical protein
MLIPYEGTQKYYEEVLARDSKAQDFYRYFETPGWAHCEGGPNAGPNALFDQLMAWVENGTAPDTSPIQITVPSGDVHERILCPFPQRAQLEICDDPARAECWACVN